MNDDTILVGGVVCGMDDYVRSKSDTGVVTKVKFIVWQPPDKLKQWEPVKVTVVKPTIKVGDWVRAVSGVMKGATFQVASCSVRSGVAKFAYHDNAYFFTADELALLNVKEVENE